MEKKSNEIKVESSVKQSENDLKETVNVWNIKSRRVAVHISTYMYSVC